MEFWIRALLLSSTFSSITSARSVFERQDCAVPCGTGCGLFGDTCCTTPSGAPNLCGYGTSCCAEGCCNFGSTCQPDGTCLASPGDPGTLPPRPTGPETGPPSTAPVLTTITNPDGSIVTSTIVAPGGGPGNSGPVLTTITNPDGSTVTSTIVAPGGAPGNPGPVTTTITTTITNPDGSTVTSTISPGGAPGGPEPVLTTITNPDGSTVTSTIVAPGGAPGNPGPITTTITNPDGSTVTSTIAPGGAPGGPSPVLTTITNPDGSVVTSTIASALTTPVTAPTGPNPAPTPSVTALPGGIVATFTGGNLVWDTNTVPVPTELTSPQTVTTLGETLVFPVPGPTTTDIVTTTLPDQMVITSSAGQLLWGTFIVPVPTGLSTTAIVTTNGEIFTFLPSVGGGDNPPGPTSTTTTDVALVTFTSWPSIVSIVPVTTDVPSSKNDDGKPTISCKAWFFFICVSFNLPGLDIFGWSFPDLPKGVYPPGPPPGLTFPPGFVLPGPGPLPPWPSFTIGNDGVPTYSEEPTSCETQSATLFVTTTSFGVANAQTTTTQVLSASNVILGCDVEDSTSMTSATSTCAATATDCASYIPLTDVASDPPVTKFIDDSNALATSVFDFVNSYWSAIATEDATTMSTITVIPVAPTSATDPAPAPTPTSLWILSAYDATCEDKETGTNFNYYSLSGTGSQTPNEPCIGLRKDAPDGATYSCGYYTNGGINPALPCSAGTFNNPASFSIRNGFCTLYTGDDCTGDQNGITSYEETGCTDLGTQKFLPKTWGSMSCFAFPPKA